VLRGTHGIGGRKYQIAAVVLTYLSISVARLVADLWRVNAEGTQISLLNPRVWIFLAKYMPIKPFLELREGFGGILGLLILGFAVRTAWQTTADKLPVA